MSLPDLINPVVADAIAEFGGSDSGAASKINYNVPLPGVFASNRITPLSVPAEWFQDGVVRMGTSLLQLGVVDGDQGILRSINGERLAEFYRLALPAAARPSLRLVADVGGDVFPLFSQLEAPRALDGSQFDDQALLPRRRILSEPEDVDLQRTRRASYIEALVNRVTSMPQPQAGGQSQPVILLPTPGPGESIQHTPVNPVAPATPRLALVETWEIRSYLGDYGLGRTLQTFSLLPGERTTITIETWRTESAVREDASSIFDSSDIAAQSRFGSTVSAQTGAGFQDQGGWAGSASTSAKGSFSILYGLVSASADPFDAAASANHQESSQRWSNNLSQSASEHVSQVNNSRVQAVQSTSQTTTASGSATTTVRDIANTNLRRVLNFVFRELNQTYETYVVLRDIQVAFFNGNPGSLEIAPLPEIQRFLNKYIVPAHQEEVARYILSLCAQRIDVTNGLVNTLQVGERPDGKRYQWEDVQLNERGVLDFDDNPTSGAYRWRFKPGNLTADARRVDGLITDKSSVVLRTDNMVVEALLGQADALDPYASALQALDLEKRDADRRKVADPLAIVQAAEGNDNKIDAWQKLFPDEPEVEVRIDK